MIQAIEDKVIVETLRREVSAGGIIMPEGAQDPQAYGKVISVGPDAANKGFKEGDIIVSHVRGGMDSVIGYKLLKVLKIDEIYGILTDEETLSALKEIKLQPEKKENDSKLIKL